jgi:broad specificity phosphatase PhoE
MHLFLVRHGETEHNVAGLLAGVSDSRLTNHGVLQTQRLGSYLANHRNLRFTHIYASDLQRAFMTAEEIRKAQASKSTDPTPSPDVVKLQVLREQDFGSLELVPWASRRPQSAFAPESLSLEDPDFRPQEAAEAMTHRAECFLSDHLLPLLAVATPENSASVQDCVAVVSHGIFLSVLWRSLLSKFGADSVRIFSGAEISTYGKPLAHLPAWSNTGFLELRIGSPSNIVPSHEPTVESSAQEADGDQPLASRLLTILAINSKDHLLNLKRTRGGVGSAPFDARQKSLEGFLKRPKKSDDPS